MNLKIFLVLCLLTSAAILNVAMATTSAPEEFDWDASTNEVNAFYVANNGTGPDGGGDEIGGGWPGPT